MDKFLDSRSKKSSTVVGQFDITEDTFVFHEDEPNASLQPTFVSRRLLVLRSGK